MGPENSTSVHYQEEMVCGILSIIASISYLNLTHTTLRFHLTFVNVLSPCEAALSLGQCTPKMLEHSYRYIVDIQ